MLTYAVITPARDEEDNLRRLGDALAAQTVQPEAWVIVDDGSTDGTAAIAAGLAAEHPWVVVHALADGAPSDRPRDAHGFQEGLGALPGEPDVVVKLDADVSVEPDYFERLLRGVRRRPDASASRAAPATSATATGGSHAT